MIRRLASVSVGVACLLSLLLSLGAGWLWWQVGEGNSRPRVSIRTGRGRYTVRADPGRVVLLCPRPGTPAGEAAVRTWLAEYGNCEVRWQVGRYSEGQVRVLNHMLWPGREYVPGPDADVWALPPGDWVRPLLGWLDDPNRFLVAHVLLCELAAEPGWPKPRPGLAGPRPRPATLPAGTAWEAGLLIRFPQATLRGDWYPPDYEPGEVDPAQFPAISAYWHDRLDPTAGSVPDWQLAAAFALPPAAWLAARARLRMVRRRRVRRGLCVACGYDLTGNASGRCPECGAAAAVAAAR